MKNFFVVVMLLQATCNSSQINRSYESQIITNIEAVLSVETLEMREAVVHHLISTLVIKAKERACNDAFERHRSLLELPNHSALLEIGKPDIESVMDNEEVAGMNANRPDIGSGVSSHHDSSVRIPESFHSGHTEHQRVGPLASAPTSQRGSSASVITGQTVPVQSAPPTPPVQPAPAPVTMTGQTGIHPSIHIH